MFVPVEVRLALELQIKLVGIGVLVNFKALAWVCLWPTLPVNLQNERLLDIEHDTSDAKLNFANELVLHYPWEHFAHPVLKFLLLLSIALDFLIDFEL